MLSRCLVSGANGAVMAGGEVFCWVFRFIRWTRGPVVAELDRVGAASEPGEAHVHGLELFARDVE